MHDLWIISFKLLGCSFIDRLSVKKKLKKEEEEEEEEEELLIFEKTSQPFLPFLEISVM
jgi:hypothetical protein